jgi:alpha-L-fucosidase
MRRRFFLAGGVLGLVGCVTDVSVFTFFRGGAPTGPFHPYWESLKAYEPAPWFRDAKLGIWAHWTPQCVPERGDWYARNMYIQGTRQYEHHVRTYGHPSQFGYKDICNLWKAERWDPDALIRLYKRAGAAMDARSARPGHQCAERAAEPTRLRVQDFTGLIACSNQRRLPRTCRRSRR